MKKETGVLTRRQEALMNFLWEIDTPLTANEMAGKLKDEGWSAVTLLKQSRHWMRKDILWLPEL